MSDTIPLLKETAGSAGEYVWKNDGDVVDVERTFAEALLVGSGFQDATPQPPELVGIVGVDSFITDDKGVPLPDQTVPVEEVVAEEVQVTEPVTGTVISTPEALVESATA